MLNPTPVFLQDVSDAAKQCADREAKKTLYGSIQLGGQVLSKTKP